MIRTLTDGITTVLLEVESPLKSMKENNIALLLGLHLAVEGCHCTLT